MKTLTRFDVLAETYQRQLDAARRDTDRRRAALVGWTYSPWTLALWSAASLAIWTGGSLLAARLTDDLRWPLVVALVLLPVPVIVISAVRGAWVVEADRLARQADEFYQADSLPDPPAIPPRKPLEGVERLIKIDGRQVKAMTAREAREAAWRRAALGFLKAWQVMGTCAIRKMTAAGVVSDPDWRMLTDVLVGAGVAHKADRRTHLLLDWREARERLETAPLPCPDSPAPDVRLPAHTTQTHTPTHTKGGPDGRDTP